MARDQDGMGRPVGKMALFGIATAGLYGAVFANSDWVMEHFTRGAWYAALPVATVFLFSFVHGAFASHLWTVLGVGVTKKPAQPRPRKVRRLVRRRRPQPQPRLNA
jgi:hypothetical protein